MQDQEKQNSPSISRRMEPHTTLPPSSKLTSTSSSESSKTGAPPNALVTQTGKLPSATVSAELRALAAGLKAGQTVNDATLKALLTQHFGQRLDIRPRYSYGSGDVQAYECLGYDVDPITLDPQDHGIVEAIEFLNRPSKTEYIAGKLARMRVMMARRNESDKDLEILMDTMMELLKGYPADAIAYAADRWMRTEKFFPLPKEFLALLDECVMLRRAVLIAMRGKPVAIAKPVERKEWKEVKKTDWDAGHWQAYIMAAEAMHDLATKNPTMFNAEEWEKEVAKRKEELVARDGFAPSTSGL